MELRALVTKTTVSKVHVLFSLTNAANIYDITSKHSMMSYASVFLTTLKKNPIQRILNCE